MDIGLGRDQRSRVTVSDHHLGTLGDGIYRATCRRVNADGPMPAVHCRQPPRARRKTRRTSSTTTSSREGAQGARHHFGVRGWRTKAGTASSTTRCARCENARCARCKTPFRRERLANEGRNGEFDDNLLARRCARCKTSFRRSREGAQGARHHFGVRLANEGRNGEFDDKVRKVRERKVCKVQDVISA